MTSQKEAKSRYAQKVCSAYLGIDEDGCESAFDKLIENMEAGLEAMA